MTSATGTEPLATFMFDELPQSVNSLYFTRGGRRVLTDRGKRFKRKFVGARGGLSVVDLTTLDLDPEAAYALELWFFIDYSDLYNMGYGSDKRVKSPYKDMDVSNLVKLAEDAISELLGIRDRNNFTVTAHKRVARGGNSGMVARIYNLDLDNDPYELR